MDVGDNTNIGKAAIQKPQCPHLIEAFLILKFKLNHFNIIIHIAS